MRGLNLLSAVEPAESGTIVTGCVRGTTGARVWQLELHGSHRVEQKIESTSEQVLGDSHLKNYALDDLGPGAYKVESQTSGLVFVRLNKDGDIELLKNERSAWRELERRR